jgi:sensor domain CHASE-containing protein
MDIKQKILQELETPSFPDLKFLFSKEALSYSLEVLRELLKKDKEDFEDLLKKENKDVDFKSLEIISDDSSLDFYWSLLNHLDNVD